MSEKFPEKSIYTLNTVENALRILGLFSPEKKQLTFAEIQQQLKLPRTTVFRLLYTLEINDYIRKIPSSGNYKLGLKVLYLGKTMFQDADILEISKPFMTELRDDLGETVDLTILDNNQALYIEQLDSVYHLKAEYSAKSRRLPLHCTACGKVLAAFNLERLSHKWPPRHLMAYTQNTVTEREVLLEQLAEVKRLGYAIERGELEDYVNAYSAPIFDGNNIAVAALTIVIPQSRLTPETEEKIIDQVKHYASKISDGLKEYL